MEINKSNVILHSFTNYMLKQAFQLIMIDQTNNTSKTPMAVFVESLTNPCLREWLTLAYHVKFVGMNKDFDE